MNNPFKKKPTSIKYVDLPTPADKIKRLEKTIARVIEWNKEANWAVGLLVDLREIREELEKNQVQVGNLEDLRLPCSCTKPRTRPDICIYCRGTVH